MKKTLIILSILFLATTAHAERWIKCVERTGGPVTWEDPRRKQGDCLSLGLCSGPNNTGLATNVFEATGTEWSDAGQSNKKCDRAADPGFRIISLTAQEISDINDALATQNDSALRNGAASKYDGQNTDALALRCLALLTVDQLNQIRGSNNATISGMADITLTQAKNAIQACIQNGNADE